jgi:hypothetical protein
MKLPIPANRGDVRETAWFLALAGYAPFLLLALGLVFLGPSSSWHSAAGDAFRTYSAIILSFLGGIRWGMGISPAKPEVRDIALSILPSLAGWFALLLPPQVSVALLLLCFCAQGAWDSISVHAGKGPSWFGNLRITLTLLVALAHGIAIVGLR